MNTSSCAGPCCDGLPGGARPRRSAPGLRLCASCYREVKANLIELPKIYQDCESALLSRRGPTLPRVSGSRRAPGIALDEDAVAARSSILGSLASWSALVADERAVARPPRRHPADLAAFLVGHLDWLLAHPAAGEFAAEITRITARALGPAYTRPALRFAFGQCIHPGCSGVIATAPPTGGGDRTHEVRCSAGHAWRPDQWLVLYRQVQRERARDTVGSQSAEGVT